MTPQKTKVYLLIDPCASIQIKVSEDRGVKAKRNKRDDHFRRIIVRRALSEAKTERVTSIAAVCFPRRISNGEENKRVHQRCC